jgi:hypothetical protein
VRTAAIFLALACAASAQDVFPGHLRVFEEARARTLEPGARARVHPAVEELLKTGDVRAVEPLLRYLVETFAFERKLFDDTKDLQKRGSDALNRSRELERELGFLRLKEKAGDTSVGPEIQKRLDERDQKERLFERVRKETERFARTIDFVRDLRETLAVGVGSLLGRLEGDRIAVGLATARRTLDIAKRDQALYLVRVLRESRLKQAEPHLLEILAHPKADEAVLRAAQYALAPLMTRQGAETLLLLWERDPDGRGRHARHALGLAARRNLADPRAARAWIEKLQDYAASPLLAVSLRRYSGVGAPCLAASRSPSGLTVAFQTQPRRRRRRFRPRRRGPGAPRGNWNGFLGKRGKGKSRGGTRSPGSCSFVA